jgi:hypothetical protein
MVSVSSGTTWALRRRVYIYGKFSAHPDQLAGVRLEFLDAAGMGIARVDGFAAQRVDDLEVMAEHVGMLIILLGDVLADRRCEGELG